MRITKYGRLFVIKKDGTCYMRGIRKGWIKAPIDTTGYYRFCIDYEGKTKAVFVHRLIAEAFVPNPNGYTRTRKTTTILTLNGVLRNTTATTLASYIPKESVHDGARPESHLEERGQEEFAHTRTGC